ncbi:MAG: hypothetical protein MJ174_09385 [Treponema sp.]|nr:hypothetical protein [Treponema sp.]
MIQKPGWTYSYLPSLGQNMAINDTTGVMYTEDKTKYTKEEVQFLESINFELPVSVHIIKKIFSGTIITE